MSDFDSINYHEYSYGRKNEGKVLFFKILIIIGYFLFAFAYFAFSFATAIQLFAVCPIFLWILIFFTWRYVSYDYFFEFKSGMLELGILRSKTKGRKRIVNDVISVKNAEYVGRYSLDDGNFSGITCVHDYSSSKSSNTRVGIVYDNKGEKTLVVFECTTKCASLLAAFNESAKPLKGQTFRG